VRILLSNLSPGQGFCWRPKRTPFAVDERGWGKGRALRRVLDAFHREESPRTGIPIHDSGPRGLGHPDLLPPPAPGAGWSCLDVARPKLRRELASARCEGMADRARLSSRVPRAAPGSRMYGIVSEPVTALAARSENAGILGPCPGQLPPPGHAPRDLDIIAGDYVHAPRERMKDPEAREGNLWRAKMGS
jgi:hypothetical protein